MLVYNTNNSDMLQISADDVGNVPFGGHIFVGIPLVFNLKGQGFVAAGIKLACWRKERQEEGKCIATHSCVVLKNEVWFEYNSKNLKINKYVQHK